MMTQRSHPRRVRTSVVLAAFAAAAVALMRALPLPAVPLAAQLAPVQAGASADTVKPVLTNVRQIARALTDQYPPELRTARVSGTVMVSMRVTETGAVVQPAVVESSDPRFNEAAVRVMRLARFRPARADGQAVPFTLHLPVRFQPEPMGPEPVPAELALPVNFTPAPVPAPVPAPEPNTSVAPLPAEAAGPVPAPLTAVEALERYYPGVLTQGPGEQGQFTFILSPEGEVLAHARSADHELGRNPWEREAVLRLLARTGLSRAQVEDGLRRTRITGTAGNPVPIEVTFIRQRADTN